MKYTDNIVFEKAYLEILFKFRNKKEIKFQYYTWIRKGIKHDCSFTGYKTDGGFHGLHFDRTIMTYFFGELNAEYNLRPYPLMHVLVIKMPSIFRDAFLYVADNKTNVVIRDNKIIELKTGLLVSG